jgi:hypothetical protein
VGVEDTFTVGCESSDETIMYPCEPLGSIPRMLVHTLLHRVIHTFLFPALGEFEYYYWFLDDSEVEGNLEIITSPISKVSFIILHLN